MAERKSNPQGTGTRTEESSLGRTAAPSGGRGAERPRRARGRKEREIKWDKLDNTAHLFPVIAGESMSNVYRISVLLDEEVDQGLLQEALERVLPWFDVFNVRIRYGVFWYYFETNQ